MEVLIVFMIGAILLFSLVTYGSMWAMLFISLGLLADALVDFFSWVFSIFKH
jgi:hypothetical protein